MYVVGRESITNGTMVTNGHDSRRPGIDGRRYIYIYGAAISAVENRRAKEAGKLRDLDDDVCLMYRQEGDG